MDFYYCTKCMKFIHPHEVSKNFGSGVGMHYICLSKKVIVYKNKTFSEMVQIERSLKIKNLLK